MKTKGFTLIELMIVVAIIGVLAAVAIPKFSDLITRSRESKAKGSLAALRSAVSIYYGDIEGSYPSNLFVALTSGSKYLPLIGSQPSLGRYNIPTNNNNPGHTAGLFNTANSALAVLQNASVLTFNDNVPLSYVESGSNAGVVVINCTHPDSKSNSWTTF